MKASIRRGTIAALALSVLAAALALALLRGPGPGDRPAPAPGRWLSLDPVADAEGDGALLDLRALNEPAAGDHGFIGVRGGRFVHLGSGAAIRFWGVNGPPRDLGGEPLRAWARAMARRGVNLVRIHSGYFDPQGEVDAGKVGHALEVVEALRAEGIYSYFSIYYPLWLRPAPGTPWLLGYDGQQNPFAALMFNPTFQERYRAWWRALLLTPGPRTGRRLVDEPAVAGVEIQNEDSLFFPTLQTLPEAQLVLLEAGFGRWLAARHGSVEAALATWATPPLPRDAPGAGRMALRPLWQVVRERTRRDQETVRFLLETQTAFYAGTRDFLRSLGFRGVIGASNWRTADARILGPLEKLSATAGDFVDRHGYFGAARQGESASWSLRPGQTFADRSALRLDGEPGGRGRDLENPVMDPHYAGLPSMISEVSWERPSRFRAEAALTLAAYGALQDSDAIVQFRVESERWSTTNRGVATPWPLTTPGQLGQFPAAALIFRGGLISPGAVVARVALDREELLQLRGTPLPQGEPLPESDLADVVGDGPVAPGSRLDPLLHLAGRVEVDFVSGRPEARARLPPGLVDRARQTVRSTTGELSLDYRAGLLVIDAPQVQGAVGALGSRAWLETADLRIRSPLETGTIVAVALDGRPLRDSARVLLQVMSEEQATGFEATAPASGLRRLLEPGRDPWQVRAIEGEVAFLRSDAARLRVTALDLALRPLKPVGDASRIELLPSVLHYLVER